MAPAPGLRYPSAMRTLLTTLLTLLTVAGAGAAEPVTARMVAERGVLRCGVAELPGFAARDPQGVWRGFNVDICRAVAAAVVGDPAAVAFVPVTPADQFRQLAQGRVDLLVASTTWTYERDVVAGVDFATVLLHDQQGLMVRADIAARTPDDLPDDAAVCVAAGTTSQARIAGWIADSGRDWRIRAYPTTAAARQALAAWHCEVLTGDRLLLTALAGAARDRVLDTTLGAEPIGVVVRQDDPRWADLIRWVVDTLIAAEAQGVTADNLAGRRTDPAVAAFAGNDPAVARALGVAPGWGARAIAAVGHYGQVWRRHLGADSPLNLPRGPNALWRDGGLLFPRLF